MDHVPKYCEPLIDGLVPASVFQLSLTLQNHEYVLELIFCHLVTKKGSQFPALV